ncbi:mitotic-spindle organizing protein 2 isoform X2 [Trichomycterus rosablanca]|uniref:mitotic-spindle organizing protein 2 isoform X2 n=1 Tax=Trichomycterus rosablanca TaxID=2290929 RepID=UPI002F35E34E
MSHSAQPANMPTAPDSPSLGVTVSGNVQKYSVKKKKVLNAEEMEVFELTQAAGIVMDQEVFKIILDLLKMNVAPLAVFQTLKAMCAGQKIADTIAPEPSSLSDSRARSKSGAGHGEKREQRVPRQASATRGQKSAKSSGSSSSSSQLTSN